MEVETPAYSRPDISIGRAQSEYLDVLRGVASQLVVIQHALIFAFPGRDYNGYGLGALGVQVFFLLSGFLITQTVWVRISHGRYSFGEFIIGRICRIYTPYVPAILLVALLDWYSSGSASYEYGADYNLGTGIANLFMLQDFPVFQILRRLQFDEQSWFVKTFGSGRQFWTVSIEWWIYVTVGVLAMLATSRARPSRFVLVCLAFAAIEPIYNFVGGPGGSLTFTWLVGGVVSVVLTRSALGSVRQPSRRALAAGWLGFTSLACSRLFFTHGHVYDPIFALLLAGVLFTPFLYYRGVVGDTLGRRLQVTRLAFHSYSLYLTHGSIVLFLSIAYPSIVMDWRGILMVLLVTNIVAVPFAFAFELPHRFIKKGLMRAIG